MEAPRIFEGKFLHLRGFLFMKLAFLFENAARFVTHSYWFMVVQSNPLIVQLVYFVAISFAGFVALKNLKPRDKPSPRDLDLVFTSVSTLTVSSMTTVQKEGLSEQQLWVLVLLMLLGGEVLTSVLGLHFNNSKANKEVTTQRSSRMISRDVESNNSANNGGQSNMECAHNQVQQGKSMGHNSSTILVRIVAGYFVATVVCNSVVIIIYFWIDSDARHVLKSKEIKLCTFSVFTAVSSFANCGFTPLNSSMQTFRKNSILWLLLIPQILAGNTLFSPLLRLSAWALGKVSGKEEYAHILRHPEETGYKHLHMQRNSVYMVLTVAAFAGLTLLQVIFICSFEWGSKVFEGMNWFQKLVASLFQSVNTRHAGEAVIDISNLSPPILVLFAVAMYLTSDTSFLPINADIQPLTDNRESSTRRAMWKTLTITKPACLAILTILACISERKSMSADPLNFNFFSIVFEVISAYGNVGYSLGYSCEKLLKPDAAPACKAASYGFVGKWTDGGRLIIILAMFLGRIKMFTLKGGKARMSM